MWRPRSWMAKRCGWHEAYIALHGRIHVNLLPSWLAATLLKLSPDHLPAHSITRHRHGRVVWTAKSHTTKRSLECTALGRGRRTTVWKCSVYFILSTAPRRSRPWSWRMKTSIDTLSFNSARRKVESCTIFRDLDLYCTAIYFDSLIKQSISFFIPLWWFCSSYPQ